MQNGAHNFGHDQTDHRRDDHGYHVVCGDNDWYCKADPSNRRNLSQGGLNDSSWNKYGRERQDVPPVTLRVVLSGDILKLIWKFRI